MNEETIIKQEESVKFSRGMTGKFSWEIKLLGKIEENINRVKFFKTELNKISEVENNDTESR